MKDLGEILKEVDGWGWFPLLGILQARKNDANKKLTLINKNTLAFIIYTTYQGSFLGTIIALYTYYMTQ